MKKITGLLVFLLIASLVFSGCGGSQTNLAVIKTPAVDAAAVERVNVFCAEFPADTDTWVLDDSTEPYILYYSDSLSSGQACNFSVNIGQPYDTTLDQEVLESFVQSYTA
ncbi:MAG: hypothetical protein J6Q99_03880, partial [Oscillospiraceae bacterium]|nr:hypothetical protein [Oscillospiraceae bacterium]